MSYGKNLERKRELLRGLNASNHAAEAYRRACVAVGAVAAGVAAGLITCESGSGLAAAVDVAMGIVFGSAAFEVGASTREIRDRNGHISEIAAQLPPSLALEAVQPTNPTAHALEGQR